MTDICKLGFVVAVAGTVLGTAVPSVEAKKLKPMQTEINAFVKADQNKDQRLSRAEFKVFVDEMAKSGQSTAKRIRFWKAYGYAFSRVDKNKNGLAEPMEMRNADSGYRRTGK